jgi:hypothetical protein
MEKGFFQGEHSLRLEKLVSSCVFQSANCGYDQKKRENGLVFTPDVESKKKGVVG